MRSVPLHPLGLLTILVLGTACSEENAVAPAVSPSPPPVTAPDFEPFTASVWPLEGLNLRQGPSQSADIITTLPRGTILQVVEKDSKMVTIDPQTNAWVRVKAPMTEGWVFGGFLTRNPISGSGPPLGHITGHLSIGTEGCPPMLIVAYPKSGGSPTMMTHVDPNNSRFSMDLSPGTYTLMAFFTAGDTTKGIGYTPEVDKPSSNNPDHRLIEFEVKAGETLTDINPGDPGDGKSFPLRPNFDSYKGRY